MSLSSSPSFPRGIATVGYSTELPEGYEVRAAPRSGCDVYCEGRLIAEDFDNYATAAWFAQDHARDLADEQAAADESAAEAAYEDELDQLYAVINARGGFVEPSDLSGLARVRAVQTVLDLIDGLATKAAA
jgi:hypothetical protein